jgi:hypothetical protein
MQALKVRKNLSKFWDTDYIQYFKTLKQRNSELEGTEKRSFEIDEMVGGSYYGIQLRTNRLATCKTYL